MPLGFEQVGYSWSETEVKVRYRLEFVRTLVPPASNSEEITTMSCVSTVSCDIAVVFQSGYGSRVVLFTGTAYVPRLRDDDVCV